MQSMRSLPLREGLGSGLFLLLNFLGQSPLPLDVSLYLLGALLFDLLSPVAPLTDLVLFLLELTRLLPAELRVDEVPVLGVLFFERAHRVDYVVPVLIFDVLLRLLRPLELILSVQALGSE